MAKKTLGTIKDTSNDWCVPPHMLRRTRKVGKRLCKR